MNDDCHVEIMQKTVTEAEREVVETVALSIWGMGCPNCAARVRNSLVSLQGVIEAYVEHSLGYAKVLYNPNLVNPEELVEAVGRAGGDGRHEYGAILVGNIEGLM